MPVTFTISLHDALPIFRIQRYSGPLPRATHDVRLDNRQRGGRVAGDRKSTRLNSSHVSNSYAVFCLKKKRINIGQTIEVDDDVTTTIQDKICTSQPLSN